MGVIDMSLSDSPEIQYFLVIAKRPSIKFNIAKKIIIKGARRVISIIAYQCKIFICIGE